jgi:protein-L-isoaspartate O-methyltransferase
MAIMPEQLGVKPGQRVLEIGAGTATLAEVTIAILQGGYLLSSTKREATPMRNAAAAALAHLRSYAPLTTDDEVSERRGPPAT